MKHGVRTDRCVFHWVTLHLRRNWSTSSVLLDHHQLVLIYPVKVIPRLTYTSRSPPTLSLDITWNTYQSTRHQRYWKLYYSFSGIGLGILRVPVRIYSLNSSQCLKQWRNYQRNSPLLLQRTLIPLMQQKPLLLIKRETQMCPFILWLPPMPFLQCLCHILRDLKWIGQSMMVFTTDSWNGTWNAKQFLIANCANLPTRQKCQKVIAWSGNFGMDLYVSWNIPKEDLTLDAIWSKFEEFSKPQTNKVRAHFDLLTSFWQGSRNVDEWYNAVQAQVSLAKYPPETAKILHRDIFWFFMKDEDFITKTINEGNVDIQKFPASKVCQLAKKMESSKATAKHIRQVAGDLLAAQVQLMQHQRTQLPTGNYPRRKTNLASGQKLQNCKTPDIPTAWKLSDMQRPDVQPDKCNRCGNTPHAKGFQCPARKFQCKICHKFGHFTSVCFQKSQGQQSSNSFQARKPKAQQLHAGALYTIHDAESSEYESGLEDTFCLQMKIHRTCISHPEVPKPVYLMTNLAYCLQEHHTRNQYLWARLDTCADVNLMPMAVYCLMFKDPQLKKLTPSNMEIETYTTEVMKIIGMCHFYLVHPWEQTLAESHVFYS